MFGLDTGCEIGFGYLHRIPLKNGALTTTKSEAIPTFVSDNKQVEKLENVNPSVFAPVETSLFNPSPAVNVPPETPENVILPDKTPQVEIPSPQVEMMMAPQVQHFSPQVDFQNPNPQLQSPLIPTPVLPAVSFFLFSFIFG